MAFVSVAVNLVTDGAASVLFRASCHHMSKLVACRSQKTRTRASTKTAGRRVASFFLAVAAVEFAQSLST